VPSAADTSPTQAVEGRALVGMQERARPWGRQPDQAALGQMAA